MEFNGNMIYKNTNQVGRFWNNKELYGNLDHNIANVRVASSNLVSRSNKNRGLARNG